MPYIGTDINYGDIAKQVVTSPGGGSTTPTGSLTYTVPKSESIMVMLDGVTQVPGVDYNVTLSTVLTFTSTVPEGVVVLVYFLGRSLDLNTPAADTVGIAQLTATGTPSASTALPLHVSHAVGTRHDPSSSVANALVLQAAAFVQPLTSQSSGTPSPSASALSSKPAH